MQMSVALQHYVVKIAPNYYCAKQFNCWRFCVSFFFM